jgi:hypothetical protein
MAVGWIGEAGFHRWWAARDDAMQVAASCFSFRSLGDSSSLLAFSLYYGPVWQGSGSSKNSSDSGSSGGVASLVELSRFKKRLAK